MQAVQFDITPEQIAYARELVDFSLQNHHVANTWRDKSQTYHYRLTGTLCEVLFADVYGLHRPARAFGAANGQDFGRDFVLCGKVIDIKGRITETPKLYNFQINAWQAERPNCKTDYYYFMQCYPKETPKYCLLLGSALCEDVRAERVAVRCKAGDTKGAVVWDNDIFDVSLQTLRPAKLPPNAALIPNIRVVNL